MQEQHKQVYGQQNSNDNPHSNVITSFLALASYIRFISFHLSQRLDDNSFV